ncbi:MAG: M20/M25/M40 family metallo-hydrolase [bacterium]
MTRHRDSLVKPLRLLALLAALALLPTALRAQKQASAPAPPVAPPLKYVGKPTTAAITVADLMSRLYAFADDSLQGREAGTTGHTIGTAYIANELKKLGLRPGGDAGTFFQDVPLISRTFSNSTLLTVGQRALIGFADLVALPFRGAGPRALDGAHAIYGGVWPDSVSMLTSAQIAGKLVVLLAPNGIGRLPTGSPLQGAAGIAIVGGELLTSSQAAQGHTVSFTLRTPATGVTAPVTLIIPRLTAEVLLGASLNGMTVGTTGPRITGNLVYEETTAPTRNVVAILPGSDPVLREQYVAIGAHSDHIGMRVGAGVDHDSLHMFNARRYLVTDNPSGTPPTSAQRAEQGVKIAAITVNVDSVRAMRAARRDSINNGADDDGSGTVAVLEVAEAFAKARVKPKRSLLFVWHTAEEKGLLGSRYFTDNPTVPRDSIVAQINLDMVGRGAATDLPAGGDNYLILVGSRRLSTELGDLTEAVNTEQKAPFAFDYAYDADGHPENAYCRSDHYNYARYGIPVVFMTTGLHGDYHQVTDEPQYIDYPHLARVTQFVFALTNRVAMLDHRPLVDKAKPDPMGSCRQ